jgi:hypothetical protein
MEQGYGYVLSRWQWRPNVEGYFSLLEPKGFVEAQVAKWNSLYRPTVRAVLDIDLQNPVTWPSCSAEVHAALVARARRGAEIQAARDAEAAARKAERDHLDRILAAERTVLRAARAGDGEVLRTAAEALRTLDPQG